MGAYLPGITDQSGQFLYEGLTGAGRSIGAGLDKLNEQQEKRKEELKQRADMARSSRAMIIAAGLMTKDEADTTDNNTIMGTLAGHAWKSVEAAKQQQSQVNAQHLQQLTQQNAQQAAAAPFMRNLAARTQAPPPFSAPAGASPAWQDAITSANRVAPASAQPLDMNMILQAGGETGYHPSPAEMLDLVKASTSTDNPILSQDLGNNQIGYRKQGSNEFQIREDVSKGLTGNIPQYDEDGTLIGHSIPTGKGRFTYRPIRNTSGELTPAKVDGVVQKGIYVDGTGKTIDLRTQFQKDFGTRSEPEAKKKEPPAPGSLKVGDVVRGARYLGGPPGLKTSWEKE